MMRARKGLRRGGSAGMVDVSDIVGGRSGFAADRVGFQGIFPICSYLNEWNKSRTLFVPEG